MGRNPSIYIYIYTGIGAEPEQRGRKKKKHSSAFLGQQNGTSRKRVALTTWLLGEGAAFHGGGML